MATHFSRTVLLLTRHAMRKIGCSRTRRTSPGKKSDRPTPQILIRSTFRSGERCYTDTSSVCQTSKRRGTARSAEYALERLATRFYPESHLSLPKKIEDVHRSGRWTLWVYSLFTVPAHVMSVMLKSALFRATKSILFRATKL